MKPVLTPREREIAVLVARGFTNKQMAAELKISPSTVAIHLGNIFEKLSIHARSSLAVHAIREGIAV